jgi:protein subunit release factor B
MQIKNNKSAFRACNSVLFLLITSPFKSKSHRSKSLKKAKYTMDLINIFINDEDQKLRY